MHKLYKHNVQRLCSWWDSNIEKSKPSLKYVMESDIEHHVNILDQHSGCKKYGKVLKPCNNRSREA